MNELIQIQNGKVAFEPLQATPAPANGGCGGGCGCKTSTPDASTLEASTPTAPSNFIPLEAIEKNNRLEMADVREQLENKKGPEFWRSLNELAQTPEFEQMMAREFPSAPASWQGVSRRDFLKLAGASLALAGLAGCAKQPEERIVPYVRQPEDLVPGRPLFFASAASRCGMPGFGHAIGVLTESHMGRPTKIEGNPDHPSSLGKADAVMQAALYTLYDPDRSQAAKKNGAESTWDVAKGELTAMMATMRSTRGAGLRLLTGSVTSPTLASQIQDLLRRYPEARWHVWEPSNRDNNRAAFNAPADVIYNFDQADVIVSLDCDFLMSEPGSVRYAKDFSDGRRVRKNRPKMNRLYAIESTPTVTGANADHRFPVQASEIGRVAYQIWDKTLPDSIETPSVKGIASQEIAAIANDLLAHRGRSIVIAGPNQSPEVHRLAHAINVKLGNVGKTVLTVEPVEANPTNNLASLQNLVTDMNAGRVSTLVVLGANPVYTAPADLKFLDAFKKVKTRVRLGLYDDETSNWCHWHLPARHFLEDWSDARAHDGTASIVQPLIMPLHDTISAHQLLSVLAGQGDRDSYQMVRENWRGRLGGDFETAWRKALNDGIIPNTAARPRSVSVSTPAAAQAPASGGLEINFFPDPYIGDGVHSNNGWLQELPKPMTKMTWDNAAMLSVNTARELGVGNYDIVKITAGGNTIEAPIWILPGQPDKQITVHFGYGRTRAGQMGTGAGFDAFALRTTKGLGFAGGVQIAKTGKQARLAVTQENHMIDARIPSSPAGAQQKTQSGETMDSTHGRKIIETMTLAQFAKNGGKLGHGSAHGKDEKEHDAESTSAQSDKHNATNKEGERAGHAEGEEEHHEHPNLMPPMFPSDRKGVDKNGVPIYDSEKKWYAGQPVPAWGMTIDLSTCIGCNSCTMACQAENNISIVGKDEVIRGRDMHWIRVDRYYRGDVANPDSYHQPVPCMHCEKAPCEPVCPVEATSHSVEGINEMTYNRCVGTKYCSNNCPYKVRRFNFLQYAEQDNQLISLMKNPDVTVRARGVMEKCTYCIQRINEVRWRAEKDDRPIRDKEIQTACQQTCPTNAIIFGNMNDKKSEIYASKAEPHNYGLLTELNTFPRTTYLARVRNPNPALEKEEAGHGGAGH